MDNKLFLVWYEEGLYTQYRFLVRSEEEARNEVKRLTELYKEGKRRVDDSDHEDNYEKWVYEEVDFNIPFQRKPV